MDLDFLERRKQARQLIIDYKLTFGSVHGKKVLFDLMNRFHVINDVPKANESRELGKTDVVKHILRQAGFPARRLNDLLKGIEENDDHG